MPGPVNASEHLWLDYECQIGHIDPIPAKWELNISCNLLSIPTNSKVGILKKHMDNKTKINKGQETYYISVCTNLEEFILINKAMNAEQGHSYAPLNSFGRG